MDDRRYFIDELILLVENIKLMESEARGGINVVGIRQDGVHVYEGIEKIANALNVPMEVVERDSEDFPYEIQVEYADVLFYQLCEPNGDMAFCDWFLEAIK